MMESHFRVLRGSAVCFSRFHTWTRTWSQSTHCRVCFIGKQRLGCRGVCRLPQWDHMGCGCWVCQRGSVGENVTHWLWMLRWGQCFTHTALKCLCTVFPPLPFIPPLCLPLFPPPINDPFVWMFLPRWAGEPQQGQTPRLLDSSETVFSCSP